ncbi:MAG: T9SS type A sorting domain-containing protein [Calditrichaeota bacterium]|nr:T9SS type A sorting domain-containing protein [Calditrichota bacterium]
MQIKRGSGLLLIVLLLGGLFFAVSAQASAPTVVSARYIDSANTLEIVFDQPVYNDSVHVVRGGITLDGDNGGKNPDLTLTGGIISGDPALSDSIQILLNYANQQVIETMVDRESLELVLAAGVFLNEAMEGSAAIGVDADVPVAFEIDTAAPAVVGAKYDAGSNTLSIDFSSPVNGRKVDIIKIAVDDDAGGPNANLGFATINEKVITQKVASTIEISLSPKHQSKLESMDTANLSLLLKPFSFIDVNRNSVIATNAENPVSITYLPDESPTVLESAKYDAGSNNLTLIFNEKIVTTFWNTEAINAKGITIHDVTNSESARLSGAAAVSVKSSVKLVIMVLPADQRLIESLKDTSNLVVTLNALSILDEFGNGIAQISMENAIPVTFIPEKEKDSPTIAEAAYDAGKNVLSLTFGNISAKTRGIDTTNVDLTGVTLDDDNGGSNPDVVLSGGKILGIKTGRPAFIRVLEITVNQEDEIKIESMANKGSISIGVKPLSFFFESYTKTRNGNHALPVGEVMVSYAPDSTAAQLSSAKYDFKEKTLKLSLNKIVDVSSFSPTTVTFGGVKLTGGAVEEENASSTLIIDVSGQDEASISGLAVEIKAAPTIAVAAGALKNLDGFANEALSYTDGDTLSDGSNIVVGYGRGFWDKSYQLFPTLDHLVPASLRAVGAHSYFYVADDQWNVTVGLDSVQALLKAFESSTPADANKGIYQICRETFGHEGDTDGDPRIIILLMDLRDEYAVASGDASADIPKAGDFDTRHEKPVSEEAHSNEADMIYVDTEPIIRAGYAEQVLATYFTNMILYNVDVKEKEWLTQGLSSMAMDICGYGYTNFRFPAEKPVLPANVSLPTWTGWTGGHPGTDINERNMAYMFMRYIYDQYGGAATISAIAASQEKGIASINGVLAEKGADVSTWSVLQNVGVAALANVQDDPEYGNTYGFAGIVLRSPTITEINFKSDVFDNTVANWAVQYHLIKSKNNPGKINFNGLNDAEFSVNVVTINPFSLKKVQLGANNEVEISLPAVDQSVYLVIVRKGGVGPATEASYVVSKALDPPSLVNVRVFQNPSVNRIINFHIVSSERLYKDVPPDEGPIVTAKSATTEKEFVGALVYTDEDNSVYDYKASVEIKEPGDYTFTVSGQNAGGADIQKQEISTKIQKLLPDVGGVIADAATGARLAIPAHAIHSASYFMAIPSSDKKSVDLGPSTFILAKKAVLTMPVPADEDINTFRIFRRENDQWVFVGGLVDADRNTVSVMVDRLGEYSLRAANDKLLEEINTIPTQYSLNQNYPNPFNPTTTISYDLPKAGYVTITVFDILGKKVATLVDGSQEAGSYKTTFDARNLASGIYFYRLNAGSFKKMHKMMVVK